MNRYNGLAAVAFGLVIGGGFGLGEAFALPLGGSLQAFDLRAAPAPQELVEKAIDFSGIVALNDCSGSLVRFQSSKPEDKALVLTNGHCYENGFLQPGEVITNEASDRSFDLLSPDANSTLGTLHAAEIIYATMTSTDITLYRLDESYRQIKDEFGIAPLTITDKHPEAGTAIRVVSGYWKRIYSCSIDGFVYDLKEGDWTFHDSIRYKEPGCEVIGGTSGSPIIDANTGMVIGINNTINQSGERCTLDNPCEVSRSGDVTVSQGTGYGQEIYLLNGCLGTSNTIDLSLPTCKLPKGTK